MIEIQKKVAVISLDDPPFNSLDHALCERIVKRLDAALAHPRVRGIVLTGDENTFSAGVEVTRFGKPPLEVDAKTSKNVTMRTAMARFPSKILTRQPSNQGLAAMPAFQVAKCDSF